MSFLELLSDWANWFERLTLNHLWQATIYFALTVFASLFVRRGPARARYLLWLAASLKFAVPSALIVVALGGIGINVSSLLRNSRNSEHPLEYIAPVVTPLVPERRAEKTTQPDVPITDSPRTARIERNVSSIPLLASGIWLSGTALFFVRWAIRRRGVLSAVNEGQILTRGREANALDEVKNLLGVSRYVKLVSTPAVKEPGVWGVLTPTILLPTAVATELSAEELQALMMHEMAHVVRWDNLVSNLNMILCCLFWFNPILWLLDNCLLKEREEACDDVVLRLTGTGDVYASSIRKIYRLCLSSRLSGLSAVGGSKLKQRLERIITNRSGAHFSTFHKALVGVVISGSVVLTLLAATPPAETVVAQTNSILKLAANNLQVQMVPSDNRDCAGITLKPCEHPVGTAIAPSALAHVVIHANQNSPIQAGVSTTASFDEKSILNDKPARKLDEPPTNQTVSEQLPSFQSSHASDLKRFTGRFGVDPSLMENFVLDINLEDGELWFKPSYAKSRRLIAQSAVEYVDSTAPNTRITFNLDSMGNVESLTVRGWGTAVSAYRLILPPPSRDGNVTFKLKEFSNARIVAVAGSFNGWNQSQYLFEKKGDEWVCRINLPPGKYLYKFIVDGDWLVDPTNPTVVRDRRGFSNSQLVVQ